MEELMKFLGDVNTPVAVATLLDGKAKVRFFSFKMLEDGKLYFLTSKDKQVYKSLEQNPRLEICSLPNEEKMWVRLEAEAVFVDDMKLKEKAFDLLPLLQMAYQTPGNEKIAMFYLDKIQATKYSIMGTQEEISL